MNSYQNSVQNFERDKALEVLHSNYNLLNRMAKENLKTHSMELF